MKKIIAILLVLFTLIAALATASSAYTNDLVFTDVKKNDWFYDPIYNCWIRDYVYGMTNEKGEFVFMPNGTLTRAQFIQMLANSTMDLIYNKDYEAMDTGFEDVKTSHWYNGAVAWGVEKGIVKGVSETRFAPNDPITREQLARMLYLFVEYKGYNMNYADDLSKFTDADTVSPWALPQVQWAVAANVIEGYGDTTMRPHGLTTRAEACTMLWSLDTYFRYDGPLDRGGAYSVIYNYIEENGVLSDNGSVQYKGYSISNGNAVLTFSHAIDSEAFFINYEKHRDDGVIESISIYIPSLTTSYNYDYEQRSLIGENKWEHYFATASDLTVNGLTDTIYYIGGENDTERVCQAQLCHEEFMSELEAFLETLGLKYEDLFR